MLITNIGAIVGIKDDRTHRRGGEMNDITMLADAWLRIVDNTVVDFGPMDTLPRTDGIEEIVDAEGGLVIPAFCDSHTHLVYPASRSGEFLDKINGLSYEEIAARGGGILNSADLMATIDENTLYEASLARVREVMTMGTGALEIKSGYGLSTETELKMLRVIARIADTVSIPVRATFLGAHAVGRAFAGLQSRYVDYLIDDMLPAVAAQGIASYVDVFCDRGFFTPDETSRILEAAARYGLHPKIHGNELDVSGGVEVAVAHNALSVDHLERTGDAQMRLLGTSDTVATMLPGASFFLGMPYGDALRAIDNNAIVALASDFNPGSSPSGDMRFVWALSCIKMRLTPVQALNAVTINGAYAMGLADRFGSIGKGCPANLVVTKNLFDTSTGAQVPNHSAADMLTEIPYRYTRPWIARTVLAK